MPTVRFRGNPYQVLGVRSDASNATIKRRWRELAREHHPDRAAGNREEAARLTTRMARINAAYDLLRDPSRRQSFDSSAEGRLAREEDGGRGRRADFEDETVYDPQTSPGPPPAQRTTPVTARFDTTSSFRPRNARLGEQRTAALRGQPPMGRARRDDADLRASTPTGPVVTRRGKRAEPPPTLQEARETTLAFGRYHGYTLGEVELLEPAYLEWIGRTITRDRDLVTKARVILTDLDERGGDDKNRPPAPGFPSGATAG
ncbi:MAG TPA: J domain-containing protein [Candidatus Limnocylindrales bacterium]|nr:J domain-containing protein [Candidatus Limnocylindrales bacterium]